MLKAWELAWGSSIPKAWGGVNITVKQYLLTDEIRSYGYAIEYLGLHYVVDDISLQQITAENLVSF